MTTFAALPQDYLTASGTSVQDWSASGGALVVSTGSASVVTDEVDTAEGMTRSLRLNYNGSAAAVARMPFSTPVTAGIGPNSIGIRMMAPATNANPVAVRCYLYDAGLTANITWYHSVPNDGIWRTFGCPYAGTTASSWTLGTTEAAQVRIDEERSGNRGLTPMRTNEYFLVGAVILNRRARPKFLIYLDDNRLKTSGGTAGAGGYPASGGTYKEILDFYGMKATVTVNPTYIGNTSVSGLEQDSLTTLRTLESEGWSIITRSIWTPDGNVGNSAHGLRTLGTFGATAVAVSSIDTGTDIITTSASHPFATGSKVRVSGDVVPGGLSASSSYFTRSTGAATVTLHPSYATAIANTSIVDITSGGTNVSLQWADAVHGKSLIRSTVAADLDAMKSLGFSGWDHYQAAQGGTDQEVQEVLGEFPLKSVRGVGSVYTPTWGIGRNAPVPDWICEGDARNIGSCFDMASIGSATTITNINNGIRDGMTMSGYLHSISAANATILDAVCAHLRTARRNGLIDVVTVEQWYDGLTQPASNT